MVRGEFLQILKSDKALILIFLFCREPRSKTSKFSYSYVPFSPFLFKNSNKNIFYDEHFQLPSMQIFFVSTTPRVFKILFYDAFLQRVPTQADNLINYSQVFVFIASRLSTHRTHTWSARDVKLEIIYRALHLIAFHIHTLTSSPREFSIFHRTINYCFTLTSTNLYGKDDNEKLSDPFSASNPSLHF